MAAIPSNPSTASAASLSLSSLRFGDAVGDGRVIHSTQRSLHPIRSFGIALSRSVLAELIAALFAALRNFFEYSFWRNLDWLMVKSRIDWNQRYNNQLVMGAATANEGAMVAGAVAGAVAAVATAYVAAAVVATETAMSRQRR